MEIVMLRLGRTMSLAGILIGAATAQVWADDTVITTFEKNNLFGTFAPNCNQSPSGSNPYFFVRPAAGTGRAVRDQVMGRDRKAIVEVITKAAVPKPNTVAIEAFATANQSN
jgi:hypothetical protein